MNRHSGQSESSGWSVRWTVAGLAVAVLVYGLYRIFLRYGASDTSQAETIIHGMLLFLGGIVLLAFLTVALAKLAQRLLGRRRHGLLDYRDREK